VSRFGAPALALVALGLTATALASSPTTAIADEGTVTISGTAYEFNNVRTMLAGAIVQVVEEPGLTTTVAEDGTYELDVPDHATLTPYITAEGYGTIHLQTFTTDGQDLVNVNFQTPTTGVMDLLALVLGIEKNDAGYPEQCAVVSTVSTKQVRGVSYENFITWGHHGVAGVTASISPEAGKRTYFNEHVIPDATVTETTNDGGVVWTELPPGEYTLTAQGAGSTWPEVHVTCADGRIVNANPPWGLNQQATTVPTKVTPTWKARKGAAAKLSGLRVAKLPFQELSEYGAEHDSTIDYRGVITVSCSGAGCFEPVTTRGSLKKAVDLLPLLGSSAKKLKAGRTLTVSLAVPGFDTRIDSWKIPRRGVPKKATTCIPLGESAVRATC
jgi:hypothetical protein